MTDFYGDDAACAKQAADEALCLLFAALHIPEHHADHPLWRNAVSSIARAGTGYVPPKRRYIGGAGLAKCRQRIEAALGPIAASWRRDGVTVASDMFSDKAGRPQANVLLINDSGAVFVESIDTKMEMKTGGYIAGILRPVIEKVGAENVVALCFDGGSNYAAACRELMTEYPHIEHIPCATHVLDLLMEDIGKIGWAKDIVTRGDTIISFVRNHHFTRGYMRSKLVNGGKGSSDEWLEWTTAAKRVGADTFKSNILDDTWWTRAEFFAKLMKLPFVVMRKTDSDAKGMMGRLYDLMLQLTEDIRDFLDEHAEGVLTRGEVGDIRKIVQDRWDNRLACDMHVVGRILNPTNQEEGIFRHDLECTRVFKKFVSKHFDDQTITRKDGVERRASLVIQEGLTAFLNLTGCFGMPDAIADRAAVKEGKMTAVAWWSWHGTEHPELTTLACRMLTQPVSASPCERNWAKFDAVHMARRNRLGAEKLRDLVASEFPLSAFRSPFLASLFRSSLPSFPNSPFLHRNSPSRVMITPSRLPGFPSRRAFPLSASPIPIPAPSIPFTHLRFPFPHPISPSRLPVSHSRSPTFAFPLHGPHYPFPLPRFPFPLPVSPSRSPFPHPTFPFPLPAPHYPSPPPRFPFSPPRFPYPPPRLPLVSPPSPSRFPPSSSRLPPSPLSCPPFLLLIFRHSPPHSPPRSQAHFPPFSLPFPRMCPLIPPPSPFPLSFPPPFTCSFPPLLPPIAPFAASHFRPFSLLFTPPSPSRFPTFSLSFPPFVYPPPPSHVPPFSFSFFPILRLISPPPPPPHFSSSPTPFLPLSSSLLTPCFPLYSLVPTPFIPLSALCLIRFYLLSPLCLTPLLIYSPLCLPSSTFPLSTPHPSSPTMRSPPYILLNPISLSSLHPASPSLFSALRPAFPFPLSSLHPSSLFLPALLPFFPISLSLFHPASPVPLFRTPFCPHLASSLFTPCFPLSPLCLTPFFPLSPLCFTPRFPVTPNPPPRFPFPPPHYPFPPPRFPFPLPITPARFPLSLRASPFPLPASPIPLPASPLPLPASPFPFPSSPILLPASPFPLPSMPS
ncbi:unnamed protein product [Closterium sp. Naga37s-1]|nr:unnamed protein product [Closterium sp. Naga37s-1]